MPVSQHPDETLLMRQPYCTTTVPCSKFRPHAKAMSRGFAGVNSIATGWFSGSARLMFKHGNTTSVPHVLLVVLTNVMRAGAPARKVRLIALLADDHLRSLGGRRRHRRQLLRPFHEGGNPERVLDLECSPPARRKSDLLESPTTISFTSSTDAINPMPRNHPAPFEPSTLLTLY